MSNKIDITGLKRRLKDIIPLNDGGSYQSLWRMLYHIRLLKYVRQSQIVKIDPRYSKICSVSKLSGFINENLLKNTYNDVYISTDFSLELIQQLGQTNLRQHNIKLLPDIIKGTGEINQLNNTEVFIQALNLPDYKALLYPNFGYIEPDAFLVKGTKEKYFLEFLEVEASKSNWETHLEKKRINYLRLAGDIEAYNYWKEQCELLNWTAPGINNFKFSVSIIGKVKKDFGEGFNFMEEL